MRASQRHRFRFCFRRFLRFAFSSAASAGAEEHSVRAAALLAVRMQRSARSFSDAQALRFAPLRSGRARYARCCAMPLCCAALMSAFRATMLCLLRCRMFCYERRCLPMSFDSQPPPYARSHARWYAAAAFSAAAFDRLL